MSEWNAWRIAELRGLAEACVEATHNYAISDAVEDLSELEKARNEFSRADTGSPSVVLSLLDELESTRAALAEAVTTIHDLRAGRLK